MAGSSRGGKNWTKMHERWLAKQTFNHPAQQIVFQDQLEVINAAQVRLAALEQQLREIVPTWTMAPVMAAYQALRGVCFLAVPVHEVGAHLALQHLIAPVAETAMLARLHVELSR